MLNNNDVLLEASNIHAWYGESHILRGIDMRVYRGQTIGLLGRNGMGKSTLIRTLLGHVSKRQGQITFFGQDCSRVKPHTIARMGVAYVPEDRGIFPNLSAHENLVMSARSGKDGRHDWSYQRVLDTFPRLGERLTHLGSQLSGGEQQMLSIGRALMTNPELIILDEATEGLAPVIVAEIWNVIADIKKSGITTCIVDCDFRQVLSYSDYIVVLQKGVIELCGSASQVAADSHLTKLLGV